MTSREVRGQQLEMKNQLWFLKSSANGTRHLQDTMHIDNLLQWLYVFKQTEYPTWKRILYQVYLFLVLRQAIKIISSWVTLRSHVQHKYNPVDALDYQTILTWPVVHQLTFRAHSPQLNLDPTADTESPDLSGYGSWV